MALEETDRERMEGATGKEGGTRTGRRKDNTYGTKGCGRVVS